LPIATTLAVVVGTHLVVTMSDQLSRPSRRILYASLTCYAILGLALIARLANLLPHDL